MSETLVLVFKVLWKLPIYIFIGYLLINLFTFYTAFYNISSAAFVVEQIIMQNNGIPSEYGDSISKLLQGVVGNTRVTNAIADLSMQLEYPDRDDNPIKFTVDSSSNVENTLKGLYGTDIYKPADFGDSVSLEFRARVRWLQPIRYNTGEHYTDMPAEFSDGTEGSLRSNKLYLQHAGGLSGFNNDMNGSPTTPVPNKGEGIVYTGDGSFKDGSTFAMTLKYVVPCLRYYPKEGNYS